MININEFKNLDLRIGTVLKVSEFPEAKSPAFILEIDLGPLGKKTSSAQITDHYTKETLPGRQVVCVVNLSPKKIGSFTSEVLVLGIPDKNGKTVLLKPESNIENGSRVS